MPVRANGYYADPALDTSFDNLAKAFSGPTGTDVAGYANARATAAKSSILQEMYNYAKDPNYDPTLADRQGLAVGNLTGVNTVGAQNQNDATVRRNADVTAATQRDVAGINNAGELARTYAKPVILSEGQTATLPDQAVAATGLPQTLSGAFKTDPGQTITKPDGSVISGTAKPMTTDELKARILGQQPAADQRAVVMEPAGVAAIVGKDGDPVNVFKADSVGKTPYEKETLQPQNGNYKTADGKVGTATFNKDTKKWVDTQTGAEIPAASQIVAPAGTQVTIDNKAPNAIEDGYGKAVVEGDLKPVIEAGASAPARKAQIAVLRDAVSRAGDDVTTGPLAGTVLKAKQALGGIFGTTLDGVPQAEVINNIGYKLASEAARGISSRPTQFEFGQALLTKPGLALSKPGMQATLNIMDQNADDDTALRQLMDVPGNRENWAAVRAKYYADHPIMSPFEPGKPLGKADIDKLEQAAPNAAATGIPATPAAASAKPATVTQNGHTYSLQPDGSYK